eukprot:Lankesteria_metandrocarpae@DN3651_c0_g1_i3.p1
MGFFCINSRNDFANVFRYLPLSPFILFISVYLGAWGGWEVWKLVQLRATADWSFADIMELIVAIFRLISCFGGLYAVTFRERYSLELLLIGYKIVLATSAMTFIVQWVTWIAWLTGKWTADGKKWQPTSEEIVEIVVLSCISIFFFAISWWAISSINSLKIIFAVGGHGWEGINGMDLRQQRIATGEYVPKEAPVERRASSSSGSSISSNVSERRHNPASPRNSPALHQAAPPLVSIQAADIDGPILCAEV